MFAVLSTAFGHDLVQQARSARQMALGPHEKLTQSRPTYENGVYSGGMLFERSHRAVNVDGCPRAYTLAISYENIRQMHGPCPGSKDTDNEHENLLIRKELLYVCALFLGSLSVSQWFSKVSTACAMAAMNYAPSGLLEQLHQLGEAANVPYVGHPNNNIFPDSQVNIATPVPENI